VAAGAGGIGSGSIFLLIANQFPQGSLANQLLTYISPWATAVVTAGWLYLQGELLFKWKFLWSLRQAIKVIARDLRDPNILDSEKQELQEQLKDMRQLRREFFRKQIKITP
jgi:hypothetical protein